MSEYVIDQAWHAERDRLGALEDALDPTTTLHLAQLGIEPGQRCLEIGAGAGSVALWMADRVGADGGVVAVDLDPRFLLDHGRPNLEVRAMDLRTESLGDSQFHVAHARLVLEHIAERDQILSGIARSLRPGGWVLIEDVDVDESQLAMLARYVRPAEAGALVVRAWRAVVALLDAAGAETTFGSRLPEALDAAGLIDVGWSVHIALLPGGSTRHVMALSLEQFAPMFLARGLLSADEVSQIVQLAGKAGTTLPFCPVVSAWGRRPD